MDVTPMFKFPSFVKLRSKKRNRNLERKLKFKRHALTSSTVLKIACGFPEQK